MKMKKKQSLAREVKERQQARMKQQRKRKKKFSRKLSEGIVITILDDNGTLPELKRRTRREKGLISLLERSQ